MNSTKSREELKPSMNVVIKNSKNNKTKEDVQCLVKILQHQVIIRSSPYALVSLKHSGRDLVTLEIRKCELTNAIILGNCLNLKMVCLSDNKIEIIPKCLGQLSNLVTMDFSYNDIESMESVSYLSQASSCLTYINLTGNTVTATKNYRRNIIKLVPSISALDNYAVADAETLSYKAKFKRLNYSRRKKCMFIDKFFYSIGLTESPNELQREIEAKCSGMRQIRKASSPAYIIQRNYRFWSLRKIDNAKYDTFVKTIVKLQSLVRTFLWSRHLKKEIDKLVQEENITATVLKTMARVNQVNQCTRRIVRWTRKCLEKKHVNNKCIQIQRWFRRSILYHKGILRWLSKMNVTGIIFTEPFLSSVKDYLLDYPSSYVLAPHFRQLSSEVKHCPDLVSIPHKASDLIHRELSFKRMYTLANRRFPRRDMSLYSLKYATKTERLRFYLLKKRGLYYCGSNAPRKTMLSLDSHVKNHHRVFMLKIPNIFFLYKVTKRLRSASMKTIPIFFDAITYRTSCAMDIQRVWRSYSLRKLASPLFISCVLNRRSIIAIQRWWRYINGLRRRFNLLENINSACRRIVNTTVYMDSWVYYNLIRCYSRPSNQSKVTKLFPEFGGVPIFDDDGNMAMQPYQRRKGNAVGINVSVPTAMKGKRRQCIPRWAWWRPKHQIAITAKPPLSFHVIMFSMLVMHCDVAIKTLDVPFKTHHQLKRLRQYRVVELNFASVLDAQIRCAMIMLLTYDAKSHESVALMSEEELTLR